MTNEERTIIAGILRRAAMTLGERELLALSMGVNDMLRGSFDDDSTNAAYEGFANSAAEKIAKRIAELDAEKS